VIETEVLVELGGGSQACAFEYGDLRPRSTEPLKLALCDGYIDSAVGIDGQYVDVLCDESPLG
jgi:hypothetical protein